jgi:hypothetical protein
MLGNASFKRAAAGTVRRKNEKPKKSRKKKNGKMKNKMKKN